MTHTLPAAIEAIVACFSPRPEVVAIALGGSRASERIDSLSDYDIYVFLDAEIPLDARRDLAARFDPQPEIGNTWFGPGDEWTDRPDGTAVDIMYWDRTGFECDLRAVIEMHRPTLGYSTAFWHTTRYAMPLHDRDGWFASLQDLATTPYQELRRTTHSSYRHQIELAIDILCDSLDELIRNASLEDAADRSQSSEGPVYSR